MNRDETNVFGNIVVTSIGLAAGWFEVSHYLGQQTVNAENDETPASEPAPARNSIRALKNTSGAEDRGAEAASESPIATAGTRRHAPSSVPQAP